jgi:predicted RNA-binding protein YlqC (UPF0109 family)
VSDVDDTADDVADEYEAADANTRAVPTAVTVLTYVAKSIVEDPDALTVEVDEDRSPLRLNVHAAPGDLGRLIGRRGRVATAIRTVVRAAASRDGVGSIDVEFVE